MQKLPVSWDCSSIQQFSPYLCVMQSFGKREYLSSFFIPAQAGIFSPAEDDVVNARSLGAWESVVISAASSPLVSLFHRFLSTSLLPPSFHSHNSTFPSRDACSMQLKAQPSPVVIVICNFPITGQLSKLSISDGFF